MTDKGFERFVQGEGDLADSLRQALPAFEPPASLHNQLASQARQLEQAQQQIEAARYPVPASLEQRLPQLAQQCDRAAAVRQQALLNRLRAGESAGEVLQAPLSEAGQRWLQAWLLQASTAAVPPASAAPASGGRWWRWLLVEGWALPVTAMLLLVTLGWQSWHWLQPRPSGALEYAASMPEAAVEDGLAQSAASDAEVTVSAASVPSALAALEPPPAPAAPAAPPAAPATVPDVLSAPSPPPAPPAPAAAEIAGGDVHDVLGQSETPARMSAERHAEEAMREQVAVERSRQAPAAARLAKSAAPALSPAAPAAGVAADAGSAAPATASAAAPPPSPALTLDRQRDPQWQANHLLQHYPALQRIRLRLAPLPEARQWCERLVQALRQQRPHLQVQLDEDASLASDQVMAELVERAAP